MNTPERTRILCVDDEVEVLKGLALHLKRHYELLTATSGEAAVDLLSRNSDVAVIIADMRMPGMDGAEFLARSRELAPRAQRILLTGQNDIASAIAAVNEGQICRFLTKPCPPPELLSAVADAVLLHGAQDRERSAMRSKLEHQHKHVDAVTGLASRHRLLGTLEAAAYEPTEANTTLVAYFIEVDSTDGPDIGGDLPWGDEVSIVTANRLKEHFPNAAVLARWGIDQFVVILQGVRLSDPDLRVSADALLQVLKGPVVAHPDAEAIRVNIGVARLIDRWQWQRLIQQAAMAAREARIDGGSGVCLYQHDAPPRAENRRALLRELRRAIAHDRLHLNYQPIVDPNHRYVHSLECLVRWEHETLGNIGPATFVPLAEQSGDIKKLGQWVLWTACHAGLSLVQDHAVKLAVNVSPIELRDDGFLPHLEDCLAHSGLAPESLEIELTETALAGDFESLRDRLTAVRNLGVRVAVDDFGSGYSSLAYISQLPIDLIKIDRVFVSDFERGGASVIRAARSLAGDLGLELVIEGVETDDMLMRLRDLGGTLFQGYLFSRPLTARDISMWLQSFRLSAATTSDVALRSGAAGI